MSLEEGRYYNLVTEAKVLLASCSTTVRGQLLQQRMLTPPASTALQRNIQIILIGNLVLLSITHFV